MDWTTGFFLVMCGIGILATLYFMYRRNNPEKIVPVQPKTRNYISHTRVAYPEGAWEQGYSDMVWAVYQMMFKVPRKTDFRLRMAIWDDPIKEMCELMIKANIVNLYKKFDIKEGRTSRQYLASQDSQQFAQYVLGGRTAIDHFDNYILHIREEQKLAEARQKGLETFDEQYTSARKALGIVRDKDYRVLTEHEEFDKQMRGIENIKKNKT